MPKWLKVESTKDDQAARGRRKAGAQPSPRPPAARPTEATASAGRDAKPNEITLGPKALLGAAALVAAVAGLAFFLSSGGLESLTSLGPRAGSDAGTSGSSSPGGMSTGNRLAAGDPGERLATVEGREIVRRDVDVEYAVQRFLQRALQGQVLDETQADGFRRDLLDRLVDRELLAGAAIDAGIVVDDALYEKEAPALGSGFGAFGAGVTTDMIREAVVGSEFGLSDADFRRWAEAQIRARAFLGSPAAREYAQRFTAMTGQPVLQPSEEVVATVRAETADIVFVIEGREVRPVREGQPAPEITLQSPDGETISLSSLRGTPVMVNFWATWCAPCRVEMPLFINAHDTNAGNLVVLGVNSQEDPTTVTQYVDAMGITFPVVLDRDGLASLAYRVRALPTTFFIDADGIVVRAHRGAILSRPQLRPMLDEIMAGGAEAALPSTRPARSAAP